MTCSTSLRAKREAFFLSSHRRVNNRAILTYHGRWETIASVHSFDHILIRPVPVRPLTVWDNFPHHNTKRPNIRSWCKLPVCDRFWCCPTYWNLTSLKQANRNPKITWTEEYLLGWALQACQCLRWNDGKLFSLAEYVKSRLWNIAIMLIWKLVFYGKKHLLLREKICLTQSEHLVVYYIIMINESSTLK